MFFFHLPRGLNPGQTLIMQTLAIFVESRYGWSAFGMGLIFLPMAIPAFFEPFFGEHPLKQKQPS